MKRVFFALLTTLSVLALVQNPCYAEGAYLTTYGHPIDAGELELMLMNDFTSPSGHKREEGQENYLSHMVELEYAPTSQLALEWMTEWFEETGGDEAKFTGFRYEARYRLFEKDVPLNPVVYVEYEDLDPETRYKMEVSGWIKPPYEEEETEEPSRERIVETRIILSQDFLERWNTAFNWINESNTDDGVTAFGYTMGVSYALTAGSEEGERHHHDSGGHGAWIRPASVALELLGGVGDSKSLKIDPENQEHYLQPSIMVHVGERAMLSLGFAIGLTRSSDDLVRLNVGFEF